MDTYDVNVDIEDHIENETSIDDFDCPNTILSILLRETGVGSWWNILNKVNDYIFLETFSKWKI